MMGGLGFGMFGIGALIMLAFWVLIIGGAIWLIQSLARGGSVALSAPSRETPLDIMKARYAKGEITKEQFEEMKRNLEL